MEDDKIQNLIDSAGDLNPTMKIKPSEEEDSLDLPFCEISKAEILDIKSISTKSYGPKLILVLEAKSGELKEENNPFEIFVNNTSISYLKKKFESDFLVWKGKFVTITKGNRLKTDMIVVKPFV